MYLAEEFAQEALMRAFRDWEKVGQLDSPSGWCYRTGVNAANSWFRRLRAERRARNRLETEAGGDERASVVEHMAVREALMALTAPQREAVVLRFYLEFSVDEAALALDSTSEAIRALTHRAMVRLRAALLDPVLQSEGENNADY